VLVHSGTRRRQNPVSQWLREFEFLAPASRLGVLRLGKAQHSHAEAAAPAWISAPLAR
jgi:hypothetical protein